jgi:hypothetical protein
VRLTECLAVLGLSLLIGACVLGKGDFYIDIGDYENQLEAWNSQNMLDYQLNMVSGHASYKQSALITVRNGIPISSDPSYWITNNLSSIPECYSYIKLREKILKDEYESGSSASCSLEVTYNTEYHYPSYITTKFYSNDSRWSITLMPLGEGDLEIDAGDYENQLEAWNSQNMLDYQLKVKYFWGDYTYNSPDYNVVFTVKNGISETSTSNSLLSFVKIKGTIPDIYSFIKEEEERIRDAYNGINRSYLNVQYDTEYHYPIRINSGIDHLFGRYERWEITLTPLEGNEQGNEER